MVLTGVYPRLERLRGEADPARVLETVPGIGRRLAQRLHGQLGIDTLEQLEVAAHDGTQENLAGFGVKTVRGVRDALASRLGRRRPQPPPAVVEPAVSELLDVDREYREKARAGQLRRIAPRRFNPRREAWLPVLHTQRGVRHYTALFSNTAQAHRLGRTKDWVVLYYDGRAGERQCTVVTENRGPSRGQRVVRGREGERTGVAMLSDRPRPPGHSTVRVSRPHRLDSHPSADRHRRSSARPLLNEVLFTHTEDTP